MTATAPHTTNNTGLSAREYARIVKLIASNAQAIEDRSIALATNYEVPAQRIISAACVRMGIQRLDWEKIQAVQANEHFEAPPKHILARWERY